MKLRNDDTQKLRVAGLGEWEPGQVFEVDDPELAEGLCRNPFITRVDDSVPVTEEVAAVSVQTEEAVAEESPVTTTVTGTDVEDDSYRVTSVEMPRGRRH